MRIHKGTHRIVIIIGCLAFRIARMQLGKFFWRLIRYDFWNRRGHTSIGARWRRTRFWLWYDLTNGIGENLREFSCYWSTGHRLLIPTYFSCGFFNIAPAVTVGRSPRVSLDKLMCALRASDDSEFIDTCWHYAHTFGDPENFCFRYGRVQFVDYGQEGIRHLLLRYGDVLERLLIESLEPQ